MPYSPIVKFPEIIANIRRRYGNRNIGIETIWNEVIFVTGSIKDATVQNIVNVMRRLDYIRPTKEGRFDLCVINEKTGRPMWETPKERTLEKEADDLLDQIKGGEK